ncbi:hypothetical protein BpHYR1_042847 [Brachionus plicatilis]|uniref:Uncharacterized protein n=1 Tax=Brachionus plicatilis TaxID=10195 RepID=A0A3M7PLC7_BRAPC|nr:hypothetical protein BpHYR1_042847 [Brachionus plicatilis]
MFLLKAQEVLNLKPSFVKSQMSYFNRQLFLKHWTGFRPSFHSNEQYILILNYIKKNANVKISILNSNFIKKNLWKSDKIQSIFYVHLKKVSLLSISVVVSSGLKHVFIIYALSLKSGTGTRNPELYTKVRNIFHTELNASGSKKQHYIIIIIIIIENHNIDCLYRYIKYRQIMKAPFTLTPRNARHSLSILPKKHSNFSAHTSLLCINFNN